MKIITLLFVIGILNQIQKCQFLIVIIILKEVLGIINILSTFLQSKTATLGKARNIVNGVIQSFICFRSDDEFSKLWLTIVKLAEKHNISLEVPQIGLFKIKSYLFTIVYEKKIKLLLMLIKD